MRQWVLCICMLQLFSGPLWADDFFIPMNKILNKYVKENTVPGNGLETAFDYVAAKNNKETAGLLKNQIKNFEEFDIKTLKSEDQAKAFWINAYNFFMLNKILVDGFKNGKLKIDGVKSFGSLFSPYKVFKRKEIKINGKLYSLDQIEKKILLGDEYKKKGWKDARVHFAVNCASVGCPPLLAEVYKEETVDKVLTENVRRALKTPRHMKIEKNKLFLTHLFKWYKKDFSEQEGSVRAFLKKYTEISIHAEIAGAKDIKYIDYDWNLNKPGNF